MVLTQAGDATAGEALPIGATAKRLADPQMVDFPIGALTEALQRGGWAPGGYTLWLRFGVPNMVLTGTLLVGAERGAPFFPRRYQLLFRSYPAGLAPCDVGVVGVSSAPGAPETAHASRCRSGSAPVAPRPSALARMGTAGAARFVGSPHAPQPPG
jgi:hypothetical protein